MYLFLLYTHRCLYRLDTVYTHVLVHIGWFPAIWESPSTSKMRLHAAPESLSPNMFIMVSYSSDMETSNETVWKKHRVLTAVPYLWIDKGDHKMKATIHLIEKVMLNYVMTLSLTLYPLLWNQSNPSNVDCLLGLDRKHTKAKDSKSSNSMQICLRVTPLTSVRPTVLWQCYLNNLQVSI